MKTYAEIAAGEAWTLVNHGPLLLACTRAADGKRDVAPFAWCTPVDYDPVSEIGFVCDKAHQTAANIIATGEFALALPHASQKALVLQAGAKGGAGIDKVEALGIAAMGGRRIDASVPEDVVAWLECELLSRFEIGSSWFFIGKVVYAACDAEAWKAGPGGGRLLVESPAGKTLHHLGGTSFTEPAALV